ncbi:MAG TPA: hypothetical protein VLK84_19395 [Longimicrobium sp.]|nr:hypothetical protein [Longimicrobium sp.]
MSDQERESARRLRAVLDEARRLVPRQAPVVAVASARTLHRATAEAGEVLPLVLASHAFTQPQFGPYARMENAWVMVIEGELRGEHLPDVLPYLEQAVAKGAQVVVAASDFDDSMLATLVINHQRNTVGVVALAPADPADPADVAALRRLASLAGARPSRVEGARLHVADLGSLPALLMTTHETVVLGAAGAQPLALIHAGGETTEEARAAAATLRGML